MKKHFLIILVGMLLLSGCSLYQKYESNATVPDDIMGDACNPQDTLSMADMSWRTLFKDPLLQRLIDDALANNTDMRTALLSIEQAQNELKAAKWGYAPTFAFTPQFTYSYQGGVQGLNVKIPATASWQLGIFGQTTTQLRKAKTQVAYSEDYQQAVQVSLAANVANLYYTLSMLDRQLEIAEQTEGLWQESLNSTRALYDAGIYQSPAVYQMEASLAEVRTEIVDLRYSILMTESLLCSLLAESPHHIERASFDAFEMPEHLHLGLPMYLLSARPDVRIAERNMELAYYGSQQALQSFFPTLNLEGIFGGEGSITPIQIIGQAVASLAQPIFSGGKLSAQLKNARVEQEKAQLEFVQTLVDAGNEVYQDYHACQVAEEKAKLLDARVNALQEAYNATTELMNNGSTTYLEVLTAQESLLSAQLSQVQNQYDIMQSLIDLYTALGGFGK